MASLAEIRQKYPQYNDMSDADLANALHAKHYSNMPKDQFYKAIGLDPKIEFANRKGSFLPLSTDERGDLQFDHTAGILGAMFSGATAPGDVVSGKLDPNSPEGAQRAMEAATMMTPMGAATRAGEAVIPGTMRSLRSGRAAVPSAEELKAAGKAGFKEVRNLGIDYSADAVKSMGDEITQALAADGFSEVVTPKTFQILAKLSEPPEGSVSSISNLIALRKSLQKAARDFTNPEEQAAASRAIDTLDDFIKAADPASVVAGPAADAGSLLEAARGNYAAAMRSESLAGKAERAERGAAATNSGDNIDNRTRQALDAILNKPKESGGFTKAELAFIDDIVRGKYGPNLARRVGNFLGSGLLGSAAGATAGGMLGGGWGATLGATLAPAAGASMKRLAGALTQARVRQLQEQTRMRSPLYQKALESVPALQGLRPEARLALEKALLLYGTQAQ